ncbi:MAG: preprotein translocase subunit SecG [Candidatus Nealsonbacteria bacterium]|nr:preprotein translocase subunit SecG [Candidatus Nealsonbacteria bacterium]
MQAYLPLAQIAISVLLIILILLQQRGQALGSAFGGGEGGFYATRRGIQKKIFWAPIVCGFLFIIFALLNIAL